MSISGDIKEVLGPVFPGLDLNRIDVIAVRGDLDQFASVSMQAPATRLRFPGGWQTTAISLPGRILVQAALAASSGNRYLATMGHELVHQLQLERIPNFINLYNMEFNRTKHASVPWANRYELPAYQVQWAIESGVRGRALVNFVQELPLAA